MVTMLASLSFYLALASHLLGESGSRQTSGNISESYVHLESVRPTAMMSKTTSPTTVTSPTGPTTLMSPSPDLRTSPRTPDAMTLPTGPDAMISPSPDAMTSSTGPGAITSLTDPDAMTSQPPPIAMTSPSLIAMTSPSPTAMPSPTGPDVMTSVGAERNLTVCDLSPFQGDNRCGPTRQCPHGTCHRSTFQTSSGNITTFFCRCHAGWIPPGSCDYCCPLPCQHGHARGEPAGRGKFDCYCQCDRNYTGKLCDRERCMLKCQNGGNCTFVEDKQVCECSEGFRGAVCDEIDPYQHPAWFWVLVAIFSVLGPLLLVTLVVTPLIMWRRRALILLRLQHFFRPYEDDDGRRFDAFVSYRVGHELAEDTDDKHFVIRQLHPRLEQDMGYKLCLDYLHFTPGRSIGDNILAAIRESRRTILVLSPCYLEGKWPQFEAHVAHRHMIEGRNRIIPIIFRELPTTRIANPTLNHILTSVTYLKWPEDEDPHQVALFWKRLALAMPKKKRQDGGAYQLQQNGLIL